MNEVVDEVREVRERAHGLAAGGFAGMSDDQRRAAVLEIRRARELLDHAEVHVLGALAESGHTELTSGMTAASRKRFWFIAAVLR